MLILNTAKSTVKLDHCKFAGWNSNKNSTKTLEKSFGHFETKNGLI